MFVHQISVLLVVSNWLFSQNVFSLSAALEKKKNNWVTYLTKNYLRKKLQVSEKQDEVLEVVLIRLYFVRKKWDGVFKLVPFPTYKLSFVLKKKIWIIILHIIYITSHLCNFTCIKN